MFNVTNNSNNNLDHLLVQRNNRDTSNNHLNAQSNRDVYKRQVSDRKQYKHKIPFPCSYSSYHCTLITYTICPLWLAIITHQAIGSNLHNIKNRFGLYLIQKECIFSNI